MLTSQKVIDAINEQIGYEFSSERFREQARRAVLCDRGAFRGRGVAPIVSDCFS